MQPESAERLLGIEGAGQGSPLHLPHRMVEGAQGDAGSPPEIRIQDADPAGRRPFGPAGQAVQRRARHLQVPGACRGFHGPPPSDAGWRAADRGRAGDVGTLLGGHAGKAAAREFRDAAQPALVPVTIPDGTSHEVFQPAAHPGWDGRDQGLRRAFGAAWRSGQGAVLLLVPSIPARRERNILIDPDHPDTAHIVPTLPEPAWWDERPHA